MGKTLTEIFDKYVPMAENRKILDSGRVLRKRIDMEKRMLEVDAAFDSLVGKAELYKLEQALSETYRLSYLKICPKYDASLFTPKYFPEVIAEARHTNIISHGFLQKYNADFDENTINIEIMFGDGGLGMMRDANVGDKIAHIIENEFGLKYEVRFSTAGNIDVDYEELIANTFAAAHKKADTADVQDESEAFEMRTSLSNEPMVNDIDERGILHIGNIMLDISSPEPVYGEAFDIVPTAMREIEGNMPSVIAAGKMFGIDFREIRGKGTAVSFFLTDDDASVTVKMMLPDDKAELFRSLRGGCALAVRGRYKYDEFAQENVLSPIGVQKIKLVSRTDDAPEKRVELHLHTNMSMMDATIDPYGIVELAKNWGHKAVAITDHGNVQGFQEAMLAAEKLGMKVIYGMEAYFVDDTAKAIYGDEDISFEDEFIVFDTETTGLSPVYNKLTEIGAVRVKDGEVLEVFNTFVNPEVHIPENITELTGISDDMVADAPKTKEAVESFLAFIGDRTLVAHNATFDMGFIRKAADDYGLKFDNAYIDTVSMSRFVNPDLKKHKLDIIAEYYGLGDFNHHRASDDAEMCAAIFYRMIDKLRGEGIDSLAQMSHSMVENTDPKKLKTYHQIILVKNKVGLKNLYRLISESYLKYYKRVPRIPKTQLEKYREGLIIGSACEAGQLFSALVDGRPWDELVSIAQFYDYLEIQPLSNNGFLIREGRVPNEEGLRELNRKIVKLGEETGKPVVATCDAHFLEKHDEIYRKILLSGMKFSDADADIGLYMRTTDEMLAEFAYLGEEKAREIVITNTNKIADEIEDGIRPFPKGTFTPKIDGAEEDLQNRCYSRAKSLYGDPLPDIVRERLEKELGSIIKNGFAVLYMIAQKLVSYSESQGYLVGSRGSVGSSFVASMGGISEVNPLPPHYYCPHCQYSEFFTDGSVGSGFDLPDKNCPRCGTPLKGDGHNIPFETFLGFHGEKSPDIDLNFSGEVQGKVHKYTEELFGAENVFRAGTIGAVASKTAYGYVRKYLDEHKINTTKAEIERLVSHCVGVKRTTGQHPGGIVVVPKENEIYDFTPVQHPADDPNSNIVTTHFTFEYLHDTLLKLDELGHDIPTKYKMIERFTNTSVMDVPMNDPEVYKLFTSTEPLGATAAEIRSPIGTLGIPEMGTGFVQGMLMDTRPQTFADLLQVSGLSHGTDVWLGNAQVLCKKNICTISSVIGTRDSIMISLIGYGMDSGDAFNIMEKVRKGKGLSPEMEGKMREAHVPDWYIDSCKKIKYLFPKAHAAAYVMSAIRLGWYKVHMPLEFYCAFLSAAPGGFDASIAMKGKEAVVRCLEEIEAKGNDTSQKDDALYNSMQLANEFLARGFRFLPVDLYKSDARLFLPENGKMRLPFGALPGLGEAAAQSLQSAKAEGEYLSVEDLQQRSCVSKAVLEILDANGVLAGLSETNQMRLF